jgi:hypothetical protein
MVVEHSTTSATFIHWHEIWMDYKRLPLAGALYAKLHDMGGRRRAKTQTLANCVHALNISALRLNIWPRSVCVYMCVQARRFFADEASSMLLLICLAMNGRRRARFMNFAFIAFRASLMGRVKHEMVMKIK